jgi:Flp pilus assembly protein TadG
MMSKTTANSKRTALRHAIRRFLVGEEEGAAFVEFTLFAPVLVIASIYTMDYGLLFYYKLELQNVAQAGVQWSITNRVYNSSAIQVSGQNATKLSAISFNVTSSQFCGCSQDSGGNPIVTQLTAGACNLATATCTNGVVGTYVSVSATPATAYQSLIPYGLVPSTYSLTAQATARIQ